MDHPTSGHDDHTNSVALAVALTSHARGDPFGWWLTYVIRPQDMRGSAPAWGGGIEGLAAQLGARYDWRNL